MGPILEVEGPADPRRRSRRRCWARLAIAAIGVIAVGLLAAEIGLRVVFGMGTPPLSMTHPTIEYMFQPNQDVHRFGNRQKYNAFGMRSDDFDAARRDPQELRVLVVGDSVINGGNLTDQSELATELLQTRLREELGRPVIVGNVSAGSWGPMNAAAYLAEFGWFDADAVVMVWAGHDAWDVATFKPLSRLTHPSDPPASALVEAVERVPRVWSIMVGAKPEPTQLSELPEKAPPSEASADAVIEMIEGARARETPIGLLLHRKRHKLGASEPVEGEPWFRRLAGDRGMPIIELAPRFAAQIDAGASPYRDAIHPSALGQRLLAEAMHDMLVELDVVTPSESSPQSPQ
ncbi:MAG: SGNH/GDSL hydrolase family protein [Planctomycetota bacterium]